MSEGDVNEYLRANVGDALSQAYTALALSQPADAIDFLGTFLKQYGLAERMKEERKKEEEDRDEYRAMLVEANAAVEEAKGNEAAKDLAAKQRYEALLETSKSAEKWTAGDDANLAKAVKEQLGADNGYLARVDEKTEGGPELQYFAGQEAMIDQVLKESEGVSFKVFEEQPAPEAVDGEDAPAHRPYQEVTVPCVTDDEAVKYFTWTKVGAYCGVPLVYNGYKTQEALDAFVAFESGEKPEVAEGGEAPLPEAPSSLVRMLVGVDTLGSNRELNGGNVGRVHALCDAVVSGKQRIEFNGVWEQAKLLVGEKYAEAKAQFDEACGTSADAKEKYVAVCAALSTDSAKAQFDTLQQHFFCPDQGVVSSLQAALLCAGENPESLKSGPYKTVDFSKVQQALKSEKFLAQINNLTLDAPKKGQRDESKLKNYSALKSIEPDTALAKAGLPAYMLITWLEAGIALRQSYLDGVAAAHAEQVAAYDAAVTALEEYEAKKAEAEAAAEDPATVDVGEAPVLPKQPGALKLVDGDFA